MHRATNVDRFTAQAETVNRSGVANDAELLDRLIRFAAPHADERWIDVACGPGVVARALAPNVRHVTGVDATPAMVDLARREAAVHGVENASFTVGDAGALALPDASFDGGLARFALHHIPRPERVVGELARVVRPGGRVLVVDTLGDEALADYAFSEEISRLRDSSHWAHLAPARFREAGERAGLVLAEETVTDLDLDLDDWLARGAPGAEAAAMVEQALAERPSGTPAFAVHTGESGRVLRMRVALALWERP
jgi:SAM-dependent methyltransferase